MIPDSKFDGHAYLFTGPLSQWQPRLKEFLAVFPEPDRRVFEREGETFWRIKEVRAIIAWAALRPYMASRKLAILEEPERFTPEAADAFLKTLEEPPPSTVFFLFSRFPWSLSATMRSRLITRETRIAWPEALPEYRKEFRQLLALPLIKRFQMAAAYAAKDANVEERVKEWLLVLREMLLGDARSVRMGKDGVLPSVVGATPAGCRILPSVVGATPAGCRILRLMTRLTEIQRLLRETSAQPRLLLDSFFILW